MSVSIKYGYVKANGTPLGVPSTAQGVTTTDAFGVETTTWTITTPPLRAQTADGYYFELPDSATGPVTVDEFGVDVTNTWNLVAGTTSRYFRWYPSTSGIVGATSTLKVVSRTDVQIESSDLDKYITLAQMKHELGWGTEEQSDHQRLLRARAAAAEELGRVLLFPLTRVTTGITLDGLPKATGIPYVSNPTVQTLTRTDGVAITDTYSFQPVLYVPTCSRVSGPTLTLPEDVYLTVSYEYGFDPTVAAVNHPSIYTILMLRVERIMGRMPTPTRVRPYDYTLELALKRDLYRSQ